MVTKIIGNEINPVSNKQHHFSSFDFCSNGKVRYFGSMPDGLYRAISSNNKDKYAYLVITTTPSGFRSVVGINHKGILVPMHQGANPVWFHQWEPCDAQVEIRIVPRA